MTLCVCVCVWTSARSMPFEVHPGAHSSLFVFRAGVCVCVCVCVCVGGRNSAPVSKLGPILQNTHFHFVLFPLKPAVRLPIFPTHTLHLPCGPAPSSCTHSSQLGRWIILVRVGGRKRDNLCESLSTHMAVYKLGSLCSESSQMLCVFASGIFSSIGSKCNEFLSP